MEQNILKIDNEDIPLVNCFSLKKNAGGYFKCSTTYHRMIWVIFNYEKIKNREIIWNLDDTIHHIDINNDNNNISNLIKIPNDINSSVKKKRKNATSKFRGVMKRKDTGKYVCQVSFNKKGEGKFRKEFPEEKDAAKCYDKEVSKRIMKKYPKKGAIYLQLPHLLNFPKNILQVKKKDYDNDVYDLVKKRYSFRKNKKGYLETDIFRYHIPIIKKYIKHRAWKSNVVIDHKNNIRDDDRKENLRIVPEVVNILIKDITNKSCQYRGIYLNTGKTFSARYNEKYIGNFKTDKEAAEIWNQVAKKDFENRGFPEFLDLVLNNTTGKKIIICEGKIGRKSGCGCLAGCCKCICAYENCKKKRDKHSRSFKERMYCSKHLRIIK